MKVAPDPLAGESVVALGAPALDRLLPMHVWLGPDGRVRDVGSTVARLVGDDLRGRHFSEVLSLRRPRAATGMDELLSLSGRPLKLTLAALPGLSLKGLVVGLPGGQGALLNLSMGISLLEAVGRFDLTLRDFAPTDLAAELLYLFEANSAVTGELRRLAQRLNGARVSAEEAAATDVLTGLANRRRLNIVLKQLTGEERPFALMHVDLDYFKQVNDSHGHGIGDAVLCEVARKLQAESRRNDLVARFGGDEFVILALDIADRGDLEGIAKRLITRLEEPITVDGVTCRISASIGIAIAPRQGDRDPVRLMREADIALYESKGAGRACVSVFEADPAAASSDTAACG